MCHILYILIPGSQLVPDHDARGVWRADHGVGLPPTCTSVSVMGDSHQLTVVGTKRGQ
jgi:hypothetical protein